MRKYVVFLFLAIVFVISCKHNEDKPSARFVLSFMTDLKMGELSVEVDGVKVKSGTFIASGQTVSLKANPVEGYHVDYWQINEEVKYNGKNAISIKIEEHTNIFLYFKVKPKICKLTYSFNANEGSLIVQKEENGSKKTLESGILIEEGSKIFFEAIGKGDFYIVGWTLNGKPVNDVKSKYELEIKEDSFIDVAFSNIKYDDDEYFVSFKIDSPITIPIKVNDSKKTVIRDSFAIAKYELTYDIWYKTYMWAIDNGYTFANAGIAGSKGEDPTDPEAGDMNKSPRPAILKIGDERLRQPVTKISWRDVIVWCNAHSEKNSLEACYKYNEQVIKDATRKTDGLHFDTDFIDSKKVKGNGYRLPYSDEWEAASRFTLSQENVVMENGNAISSIINGKIAYFTKGDSASGAKKNYADVNECKRVAWFDANSGEGYDDKRQTHVVATKEPNDLGLFDMAGNVYEFVTEKYRDDPNDKTKRIRRGGAWWFNSEGLRIGSRLSGPVNAKNDYVGFRLAKNIGEPHPEEIQVEKILIGQIEYLKALDGKKLTHLESGDEEVIIPENEIDIAVYVENPKELKVELLIDGETKGELVGSSGIFEKTKIAISENFKIFTIILSKDGYIEKKYSFKVKREIISSIPESLRIRKLYVKVRKSDPEQPLQASNNGYDYNVELDAKDAGCCFFVWILGEETKATFREKGYLEEYGERADGYHEILLNPVPQKNETKTFVVIVSYNGQEVEYNLNVSVKDR